MQITQSPTRKSALYLASALLIAGLAACGGGGDDEIDPLRSYREQTVQWTACDPSILGREEDWGDDIDENDDIDISLDDAAQHYGERLRCAQVRAPLDWAMPERGDVAISVMRLAAGKPEQRRGALLFNPGGPGADGLPMTLLLHQAFSQESKPDHPQGALQLRLLDEYDMVGFSPRGTGASTRVQCATNELEQPIDMSAAGLTPQNIANARYNSRKIAEACLKNPITPYINTDATARDLDLLRGLLGDDKLNYVGYSYGTWLGAWYASLFPERVGRMVLDSSTDFTRPIEAAFLAQPPAAQRLMDEVLAPYAARHAEYFRLGRSEAEVRAILPSLSPRMQHTLFEPLSDLTSQRDMANEFLVTLAVGRDLDTMLKALPEPVDEDRLQQALDEYVFDPASPARDAALRRLAGKVLEGYVAMWIKPERKSFNLDDGESTFIAVRCNDTPATTDLTVWYSRVEELAQRAPLFFGDLLVHPCGFWDGPRVHKPDLAPMQALDVLFVQSQYDAATATEGANAFFAELPTARRVYVPGEFQHGIYPYEDDNCVDLTVTRYLLGESPAQRETVCPAHPLARDVEAVQAQEQAAALRAPTAAASVSSAYKNPERARKLIEQFKDGMAPPRPWR